jgi:hypothetical protein
LQRASHTLAEQLYKQAQPSGASSSSGGGPTGASDGVKEGEVVDAEYAETK